jgi:hypothetical protein
MKTQYSLILHIYYSLLVHMQYIMPQCQLSQNPPYCTMWPCIDVSTIYSPFSQPATRHLFFALLCLPSSVCLSKFANMVERAGCEPVGLVGLGGLNGMPITAVHVRTEGMEECRAVGGILRVRVRVGLAFWLVTLCLVPGAHSNPSA